MQRIKVRNGTNATLPVKARVVDKVKGYPVESHFPVLPKTSPVLTALHFFLEDLPRGMTVLWKTSDTDESAPEPAPAPAPVAMRTTLLGPGPAAPQPPSVVAEGESVPVPAPAPAPAPKSASGFSNNTAGNRNKQGARE